MSTITFVPTQRGGTALIFDGYRYNKVRCNNDKNVTYWRCSKNRNCPGRAVTVDNRVKKTNNKHNHPPEAPLSHHAHHNPFMNMAAVAAAAAAHQNALRAHAASGALGHHHLPPLSLMSSLASMTAGGHHHPAAMAAAAAAAAAAARAAAATGNSSTLMHHHHHHLQSTLHHNQQVVAAAAAAAAQQQHLQQLQQQLQHQQAIQNHHHNLQQQQQQQQQQHHQLQRNHQQAIHIDHNSHHRNLDHHSNQKPLASGAMTPSGFGGGGNNLGIQPSMALPPLEPTTTPHSQELKPFQSTSITTTNATNTTNSSSSSLGGLACSNGNEALEQLEVGHDHNHNNQDIESTTGRSNQADDGPRDTGDGMSPEDEDTEEASDLRSPPGGEVALNRMIPGSFSSNQLDLNDPNQHERQAALATIINWWLMMMGPQGQQQ